MASKASPLTQPNLGRSLSSASLTELDQAAGEGQADAVRNKTNITPNMKTHVLKKRTRQGYTTQEGASLYGGDSGVAVTRRLLPWPAALNIKAATTRTVPPSALLGTIVRVEMQIPGKII